MNAGVSRAEALRSEVEIPQTKAPIHKKEASRRNKIVEVSSAGFSKPCHRSRIETRVSARGR